jgi:digeranylgeranylglycerophospholipid reductase
VIDVAIIGGGPAGLHAASRLAAAGLDVTVFEEHAEVGAPVHCTGIVSLETAEYAKIPDELILSRLTFASLIGPAGARAEHRWQPLNAEPIVAIDRSAFDRRLADDAQAAGAALRLGARVERVAVGERAVMLEVAGRPVEARVCVLACGVSYRFQRQLGLGLPAQVVHTAQVEVDARAEDGVELYFGRTVAPEGFLWTAPVVRDGRARLKVGVIARGDAGRHLGEFVARPAMRARLLAAPGIPVRRLLPLRPLPKTYGDRVLVVGDAGGFTKPTTGGGIFYSLLTASLAAEAIVQAFGAGRFDDAFLARYEARWQARLGQELRVADWLRGLVAKCKDAEIDTLVRALGAGDVQTIVRQTARFNWHRDLILALARQPGIASLLVRALLR